MATPGTPGSLSLSELTPLVSAAAEEFGVPEDSIWRKVRAENSGSPAGAANLSRVRTDAISSAGARGIMQVTPIALADVIRTGLIPEGTSLGKLTPKDQIRLGAAYIRNLRDAYPVAVNDPAVEDAMYNFGPKARFQMDNLPAETRGYLEKTGASPAGKGTVMPASNTSTQAPGTGIDFSNLIGTLLGNNTIQNQQLSSGIQEVGALQQKQESAQLVAAAGHASAVAQAAGVAAQNADIQYQKQALGEQLQRAFNLDPAATNNEIATSLAAANTAAAARIPVRAEFDKANSVSFFDNPLQYLVNQVKLPQLAARNNALADQEDLALENIAEKTRLLAAAKSTLAANTADSFRQAALDQAKALQTEAKAKLSDEEAKNLSGAATRKLQLISFTDKLGDNTRAAVTGVISLQMRDDQAAIRKAVTEATNEKKQIAADQEALIDGRLKTLSDSLGQPVPMTLKVLKTLPAAERNTWLTNAQAGQYGSNLLDSLAFYLTKGSKQGIQSTGGASVYSTAQKLRTAGVTGQAQIERQALQTGQKLSNKQVIEKSYKDYTELVTESMRGLTSRHDLSSSTWDKTYNPYVAPFKDFNVVISANPEKLPLLQNNVVTKAVGALLSTGVVPGDNLSSEQQKQIWDSIATQVQTRVITPKKAAADIATYINAAAAWNQSMNGYTNFSLPPQDAYLFTTSEGKKVNLMDPAAVENAITKQASHLSLMGTILLTPIMTSVPWLSNSIEAQNAVELQNQK